MTTWIAGIESSILNSIIAGSKTIEGRLGRGKFEEFQIGDHISLRRDYRDEQGTLRDGEPGAATVKITDIRQYASFADMIEVEGYQRVIPSASSPQEAADEYNRFYSTEDQSKYGVLAIEIKFLQ